MTVPHDRSAEATARGKLLLFGEHAAVHGYPAVGLTLPLSLTLTLAVRAQAGIEAPALDPRQRSAIEHALSLIPKDRIDVPPGLTLTGRSDIPIGRGFGSSGALCAALSRALLSLVEGEEPFDRAWEIAHAMEHAFHGTPSGIDTGLALMNSLVLFRPQPPSLPSVERLQGVPIALLAVAVPRTGSSLELVGRLSARIRSGDGEIAARMADLGALASEAALILGTPRTAAGSPSAAAQIGESANRAHGILRGLGLSTAAIERVLEIGKRHGALGGKLSGAGGGGALYLLFEGPEGLADALRPVTEEMAADPELADAPRFPVVWDGRTARIVGDV